MPADSATTHGIGSFGSSHQLTAVEGLHGPVEELRSAETYNVQQIQNPDGTITIVSDNIRVTVRPIEGFTLPTDPAERQAVLDAALERKDQDDQQAYQMTTEEMRQQAMSGTADERYYDSEQHWVWAMTASARTGGQIPPEYFMRLDPYGGTAGNGPDIVPMGDAGQPLSTVSIGHDADWDIGRYFHRGPLSVLGGMEGVDPAAMGTVGLSLADPSAFPSEYATAVEQVPTYDQSGVLSPEVGSDWQVQYSQQYANERCGGRFSPMRWVFREDQIFEQ